MQGGACWWMMVGWGTVGSVERSDQVNRIAYKSNLVVADAEVDSGPWAGAMELW